MPGIWSHVVTYIMIVFGLIYREVNLPSVCADGKAEDGRVVSGLASCSSGLLLFPTAAVCGRFGLLVFGGSGMVSSKGFVNFRFKIENFSMGLAAKRSAHTVGFLCFNSVTADNSTGWT